MDKSETIEEFMNTAIQEEVENLGIELSKDDCEEIKWAVLGDIGMLIQNKIHEVIDYYELFERNETDSGFKSNTISVDCIIFTEIDKISRVNYIGPVYNLEV